jgi:hypothetical protein
MPTFRLWFRPAEEQQFVARLGGEDGQLAVVAPCTSYRIAEVGDCMSSAPTAEDDWSSLSTLGVFFCKATSRFHTQALSAYTVLCFTPQPRRMQALGALL